MITVTGATGNIGRTLVDLLTEAGEEVTAVSRTAAAVATSNSGIRSVQADLATGEGLPTALDGARALFLLLGGALNIQAAEPARLIDAARQAGVERIVLVSSQVSATRPGMLSHAGLREYEAAVRESGLETTVLRPAGFASNAFAWADSVRSDRTVFAPFGDVALPVVDPADIAAVAAAALREDGHAGRTYELTGPAALSPREQTAAISRALGEDVSFVELSRDQAHAMLSQFMPEQVATGTLDVLGTPLPEEARVSRDAETVLGRPASTFDAWVARNLPAFR